jgi:4-coumarate--CoA ligase
MPLPLFRLLLIAEDLLRIVPSLPGGLEARLVDDDEVDIPRPAPSSNPDGRGELWIRGGNVMKGYWSNAEASKKSITSDGWFKTGDVAVINEDGLY